MSPTTSEDLHEQWLSHGGDLREYEITDEVTDENGRVKWFRSGVVRWRDTGNRTDTTIQEKREPLDEQSSHLRWKHAKTATWMHLKSDTSLIVGSPIGFRAYVTINGQHLTVGEGFVSDDPEEVINWARGWMETHPDGYTGE